MPSITVNLTDEIKNAVERLSQQEGLTTDELVRRAIKQHVFVREFRTLRERLAAKARQQGIETDQDVFDRIS